MAKYRFGDLVKEVKEKVDRENNPYEYYIAGDHMDTDELHLLRRGTFNGSDVGPAFIRVFKPGQVLYGSRRTYLRKVAVADFEGITANTTFVLETKDESVLLQRLLPFIMQSDRFVQHSIGRSKGSTNPYVLFSDLYDYEFELPDLEKQRKLADLLWSMDEVRMSYKKLISATDELVKSQFMEQFGIPGNGNGYIIKPIADVSEELFAGGDKPNDNMPEATIEYPYPVYSNGEGPNGLLCFSKDYRVDKKAITISARGAIGYSAIREPYFTPVVRLLTVVPKSEMNIVFLKHFIDASKLTGTGSSQGQLTLPEFKKLMVPVPPLDLQEQFAAFVRQSDKSKFAVLRCSNLNLWSSS